jgi:hypothetical protein
MKKVGRNDPCYCGSGKKFKKCCALKVLGGRSAQKIDAASAAHIKKAAGLSGLFRARLAETPKKPMPSQEVAPSDSSMNDIPIDTPVVPVEGQEEAASPEKPQPQNPEEGEGFEK